MDIHELVGLVRRESALVESFVRELPHDRWQTPTPAIGWTVADQVGHLHWTDSAALLAITDPDSFAAEKLAADTVSGYVDQQAQRAALLPPGKLLSRWQECRDHVLTALSKRGSGDRIAWFGPPMSAASMATARLMETWAHGQDIADALNLEHAPDEEVLANIAHLGVKTRDFTFTNRGMAPPQVSIRVELTGQRETLWSWGEASATERVSGPLLDFCLAVTQRRNLADLRITTEGRSATRWISMAQAFAGEPTDNRRPLHHHSNRSRGHHCSDAI